MPYTINQRTSLLRHRYGNKTSNNGMWRKGNSGHPISSPVLILCMMVWARSSKPLHFYINSEFQIRLCTYFASSTYSNLINLSRVQTTVSWVNLGLTSHQQLGYTETGPLWKSHPKDWISQESIINNWKMFIFWVIQFTYLQAGSYSSTKTLIWLQIIASLSRILLSPTAWINYLPCIEHIFKPTCITWITTLDIIMQRLA